MSMTDIDAIKERLDVPGETFTADEVRAYADWQVNIALKDDYHQSVVATQMERAYASVESVNASMQQLLALIDPNVTPTLEVIE